MRVRMGLFAKIRRDARGEGRSIRGRAVAAVSKWPAAVFSRSRKGCVLKSQRVSLTKEIRLTQH